MEEWKIEQVSLAGYSFRVENDEFVFIGDTPTPSKLDAIFEEYDAQAYARNRKAEYNQLEQFEMQFDDDRDSTTTWVDTINEIKGRHPK